MSYTIEKKDNEVSIAITIPWSEATKKFDENIDEAIEGVSVKGFRKGSVPREIAEEHVDRTKILADVANTLLGEYYADIVQKEKLRIAGAPQVNLTKLAEGNDIEVKIVVSVLPEITLPENWRDPIKKINEENKEKQVTVTDKEVDEEIAQIARSRATHKEVDRAAKEGDHVKIDFTVKQDGVVIENGTGTDHSLVLGKGVFIPGFEEKVVGMKKGDEKTFELTFPDEYHAKHLAGKKAQFDVTLKVVEELITPKIDDDFATSLGDKFKNLDDLKKNVKEGIQKERTQKSEEEKRTQYLEALVALVDVDVPQAVINEELQRMFGEFEQQLSMSGVTMDDYLAKIGKKREDLEKEWTPQAKKRIISALVLEQLAEDNEITIDNKKVEEEMNKTLAMYKDIKDVEKNIDMGQLYEYTKGVMRNNAVFDILEKI